MKRVVKRCRITSNTNEVSPKLSLQSKPCCIDLPLKGSVLNLGGTRFHVGYLLLGLAPSNCLGS